MNSKIRVAIIGAGASGLAALRHLSTDLETFIPIAYDKGYDVGGVWVYTDNTELDDEKHCNTLYKSLRTNLPKEVMGVPDEAFLDDLPSFLTHDDVRAYYERYATKWKLHRFVKFRTIVQNVRPTKEKESGNWTLRVKDLDKDNITEDVFDAVLVCNGHLNKPYIPEFPGSDYFEGHMIHSRQYRVPEAYRGQKVMCVGGSFSGRDITIDIASVADQVYLSHRGNLHLDFPANVQQVPTIRTIGKDNVILIDGRHLQVDAIILCTGYKYDFPFLSPECGLSLSGDRISPLYKHMVNINFPSMFFIGLPRMAIAFICASVQAEIVCKLMQGVCQLPSKDEMYKDEQRDFMSRSTECLPHDFHYQVEVDYYSELHSLFGTMSLPEGVRMIYQYVCSLFTEDINFKEKHFLLSKDKRTYREVLTPAKK